MRGIRGLALAVIMILLAPLAISDSFAVQNKVTDVKVLNENGKLRLEIVKTGQIEIGLFKMSDPDRLVVNCIGARYDIPWQQKELDSPYVYRIRTSQFKEDPISIVRIVLDLKKDVDYLVSENGTTSIIDVYEKSGDSDVAAVSKGEGVVSSTAGNAIVPAAGKRLTQASMGPVLPLVKPGTGGSVSEWETGSDTEKVSPVEKNKSAQSGENHVERVKDTASDSPWIIETKTARKAENVSRIPYNNNYSDMESSSNSTEQSQWTPYAGGAPAEGTGLGIAPRRITIDAQGADIKTVLRTISDFAGKNIVYGPDVKGDVYVHIKDVPWEEALDILLKAHGYAYREEYGMIRVAEASRLMKEELEDSNAEEMKEALQNIVSSRGKIDVDRGSNALIVNDIERNVEKIEEMVKALDRKTYQVDINAKLAEIDVEATRELGINWGLLNMHASGFSGVGSASVNSEISLSAATLKFGTVRSWGEINAILDMLEQSNKANIISNPRITTMDNREASILVGKEIPLIVADEAGNPITELTKIGIMLRVIPHVNADRTITLDLHPEVSELQSESTAQGGVIISTSEADTRVVVKNGETAVIGGLIKKVKTDLRRGVPILKDIPIIGGLFSSTSTADKKQELVIFVTPTIVE